MEVRRYPLCKIQPVMRITAFCTAYVDVREVGYVYGGEMHDFWECVFVLKGRAAITAGESVYQLGEGQMIFHPPMEFHRICNAGDEPIHFLIVSFTAEGFPMDSHRICTFPSSDTITELVKEGWLYRVKSKGTFVSTPKINQDFISKLVTFQEEMDTSGKTAMTEVLELKVLPARDQIADMLQLEANDPVVYLHRRRFADGEPIVTVETFLSYADCAYVMERDLVKQSLYDIMSEKDETEVHCVKRRVEAVEATSDDSKLLGIKKGKPVQLFCSQGFNVYGKPVEYSVARYRADRNSFEVTVFADKKN